MGRIFFFLQELANGIAGGNRVLLERPALALRERTDLPLGEEPLEQTGSISSLVICTAVDLQPLTKMS